MKKMVRWIVLVIVGGCLGINVYLMNASHIMQNELPMPFGIGASVVLSGSMEPELSIDDLIIVQEKDEYIVNDIVVFEMEGSLIVHRIVEVLGDGMITKGDANNIEDEKIENEYIKGKVIFSIPKIGQLIHMIKSPFMTFIIIVGAIGLIELSYRDTKTNDDQELEKIREEIRRLKEEK